MKKNRALRRVGVYLFVGCILLFLVRSIYRSWKDLQGYQWTVDYRFLTISFLFLFVLSGLVVLIWKLILKKLGASIAFKKAFRIWFLSHLGRYIPGRIWHFVGMVYLCEKEGIPAAQTGTSAVIAQVLSLIAGILIATMLVGHSLIQKFSIQIYLLILISVLGIFLIHPSVLTKVLNLILRLLKKERISFNLKFLDIFIFFSLYLCIWLLQGTAFYFFVRALRQTPWELLLPMTGAFAGAYVIGLLSTFVPAGLGVREGILTALLALYFPLPLAVIISVSSRIWLSLAELVCLGASMLV